MTESERARDNAAKLAATVLPQLQEEHDAIVARLAEAIQPAERAQLERQFGERLRHLKERLPGNANLPIRQEPAATPA